LPVRQRHTSDAIGRNKGTAAGRVDSGVASVADDVEFVDGIAGTGTVGRIVDYPLGLDIALPCTISPHSDAWGHIINMFLNMRRDVVFVASNVLIARAMLPEIEIGEEEVLGLIYHRVELDPLTSRLEQDTRYTGFLCGFIYADINIALCCLVLACLFADWLIRLGSMPELTSQSITASTLD
jgi:hypothetical protein